MRKTFFTIIVALLVLSAKAQNADNNITGNWYNEKLDKSTINIYKATDGFWYAKIIKSSDNKNIGKTLLSKVKFNATDNNYTGILSSPKNGIEINATITFTSDGKLQLVGKKLFITKTYSFTRA